MRPPSPLTETPAAPAAPPPEPLQRQPEGWMTLRCDCGAGLFRRVYTLTWKEGGGTVETPAGFECQACQGVVDAARLIDRLQLVLGRRRLQELEAELAARGE